MQRAARASARSARRDRSGAAPPSPTPSASRASIEADTSCPVVFPIALTRPCARGTPLFALRKALSAEHCFWAIILAELTLEGGAALCTRCVARGICATRTQSAAALRRPPTDRKEPLNPQGALIPRSERVSRRTGDTRVCARVCECARARACATGEGSPLQHHHCRTSHIVPSRASISSCSVSARRAHTRPPPPLLQTWLPPLPPACRRQIPAAAAPVARPPSPRACARLQPCGGRKRGACGRRGARAGRPRRPRRPGAPGFVDGRSNAASACWARKGGPRWPRGGHRVRGARAVLGLAIWAGEGGRAGLGQGRGPAPRAPGQ
jgi:hypothetical protein